MDRQEQLLYQINTIRAFSIPFQKPDISSAERSRQFLREDIQILYFENNATVAVDRLLLTVAPGDTVIVNPYEFHAVWAQAPEPSGCYYAVRVAPSFILSLESGLPESKAMILSSGVQAGNFFPKGHPLAYLAGVMVSAIKKQQLGDPLRLRSILHRFFCQLLEDRLQQLDSALPREKVLQYDDVIQPALNKMREDFSQQILVEQLAAVCGISKFHFCRVFKLVTGKTPVLWLSHFRLQIAMGLLLGSDITISEIAAACGFDDTCYFCRFFKKRCLISAQSYRREVMASLKQPLPDTAPKITVS